MELKTNNKKEIILTYILLLVVVWIQKLFGQATEIHYRDRTQLDQEREQLSWAQKARTSFKQFSKKIGYNWLNSTFTFAICHKFENFVEELEQSTYFVEDLENDNLRGKRMK